MSKFLKLKEFLRHFEHVLTNLFSVQFNSVAISSIQLQSVQFSQFSSSQFISYFICYYCYQLYFNSVQCSCNQFSSIQLQSLQFSSIHYSSVQITLVDLCRREQALEVLNTSSISLTTFEARMLHGFLFTLIFCKFLLTLLIFCCCEMRYLYTSSILFLLQQLPLCEVLSIGTIPILVKKQLQLTTLSLLYANKPLFIF